MFGRCSSILETRHGRSFGCSGCATFRTRLCRSLDGFAAASTAFEWRGRCRPIRQHAPLFGARAGRCCRSATGAHGTCTESRHRTSCFARGRASRRWNVLRILILNPFLKLRFVRHTLPTMLDFWLFNLGFHRRRLRSRRRLSDLLRRPHQELVPLNLGERPGFNGSGKITRRLPFDGEPLNRPARVLVNEVVIGAVIINYVVLHRDVGHVHGVCDVRDILHRRKNAVAQHRFADKPDIAKVVIFRADIECDVHVPPDRLPFINNARPAWRQRRPANVIATGSP
jgi:hypothetical protein